jgi:hypothetical protein
MHAYSRAYPTARRERTKMFRLLSRWLDVCNCRVRQARRRQGWTRLRISCYVPSWSNHLQHSATASVKQTPFYMYFSAPPALVRVGHFKSRDHVFVSRRWKSVIKKSVFYKTLNFTTAALGGLVVSVLATGPTGYSVAGSNPTEDFYGW